MDSPEPIKSASRSAMRLSKFRGIFWSSEESTFTSSSRSRSVESEWGASPGHRNDHDGYAVMHQIQGDLEDYGVNTSIDTIKESGDWNILCIAPEKNAWLLLSDCWIVYRKRQAIVIKK